MVFMGFVDGFQLLGFGGVFGDFYNVLKDYVAIWVLIAVIVIVVRWGIVKSVRYDVSL